jgi:hypothetical protein
MMNEGRSLLMWSTFDAVPAGDVLSRRLGARVARVNRTSELVLADVDRTMTESWTRAERARDLGYRLERPVEERKLAVPRRCRRPGRRALPTSVTVCSGRVTLRCVLQAAGLAEPL